MNNAIKDFYENNSTKCNSKQKGFMGKLYYMFQKYNIDRNTKCLEIIDNLNNTDNIFNVIDIGCGKGNLLLKICNILPKIKSIYGIDIDEKILFEAKKNITENTKIEAIFKYCDLNNGILNIDKKFNLVTILAVLEHVFDPDKVIKDIYNIMDNKGIIILQVPNIVVLQRRISFLFGVRPRTSWDNGWDGGHICFFTKKDVIKLVESNGFKVMKTTGSGIFGNLRNKWVSLLSPDIIVVAEKNEK